MDLPGGSGVYPERKPENANVFEALADPTRREVMRRLAEGGPATATELAGDLPVTRQAVAKHLAVLENANLLASVRRGREKLHYLNAVPIHEIGERWISKYDRRRLEALSALKKALEDGDEQ